MKQFLVVYFLTLSCMAYSQEITITGTIQGTDSIPVTGATIMAKGTTLGTVSDNSGNFILKVKPGIYTIRVSLVGFETVEQTVDATKGRNHVNIIIRETNINLNEVVVTATRTERTLKDVPVITQVISAKQMIDLGITSVPDALQNMVPGLDVSQFGTRTSITLQGMDSKYVLFLIDGERIAGEVNGDIDYSMLNMENIERIEVIKGASSSLYGSNAIGGVINIITKRIPDTFEGKIYTRYSKYNELFSGAGFSLKKGIFGSRTSVYQFERGNVSARPAHDLYQDFNAGLKGRYYFGNQTFDFSYYRDRYNTYNVLEQLDNKKDIVSYDILQTARIQGNFRISDKNSLTAGLEYNHESLYSIRNEGGLKGEDEAVAYIQEDLGFGEKWNFVAGIRTSYHTSYGFHAAPKVTLLLRTEFLNFRSSVGTGFRSPSLKELYLNFDHFGEWYIIGNPDLKPETSKYLSGSVEFSKPWNNSSVTVYRNVLSDMITDRWLPDSVQMTRQYQNIASAHIFGIDFMSKQRVLKGLWLSTGYSYVNSHDNETDLQLYGTTKHSGNIAADYNFRRKNYSFTVQIYGKIMGEKFYEITDEKTYLDKPYNSWRFTLSQEYKWIRLSTGIDNIFDVVMPENINFISPGRRFFIGLNLDFGKLSKY